MVGKHDDVAESLECKLDNSVVSNHLCQAKVPFEPFVPVGTVENWYDFLMTIFLNSRDFSESTKWKMKLPKSP